MPRPARIVAAPLSKAAPPVARTSSIQARAMREMRHGSLTFVNHAGTG
jgi:hypothetical protein